ncbi:MAG: ABC transporter ATP-binding protein, partial [Giesbergeria sp.]
RYPAWDEAALARHVEGFSLAPHQDKAFFMLSTGTRRKAWLAAALASGAPLTLIDEPLAGLDLASARYLAAAIAGAVQQPGRVIVVAHDEPLEDVPWIAQLVLPDAI